MHVSIHSKTLLDNLASFANDNSHGKWHWPYTHNFSSLLKFKYGISEDPLCNNVSVVKIVYIQIDCVFIIACIQIVFWWSIRIYICHIDWVGSRYKYFLRDWNMNLNSVHPTKLFAKSVASSASLSSVKKDLFEISSNMWNQSQTNSHPAKVVSKYPHARFKLICYDSGHQAVP